MSQNLQPALGTSARLVGWVSASRGSCKLAGAVFLLSIAALPTSADAQVSLATAVDLALTHSAKIRLAQSDIDKARASLDQAHDVYIPVVTAGAGIGESYGYSPNPPTLFTFNAQSLVFNFSQKDFIRASRFGLNAAELALQDARQGVIEDTALSFLALEHDQQREAVLNQENDQAKHLVEIVEDRVNAGRDTGIDLTTARLTAAQFHLAALRAQDETANDRDHLALALGLQPSSSLHAEGPIPAAPTSYATEPADVSAVSPVVAAAYATAQSKEEQTVGDHRYLFRPQFSLIAQYNRYATFTDSFSTLQSINRSTIHPNEYVFAVEIQVPLLDKVHKAKADESAADARHARAQADDAQRTAVDGELKLRHSLQVLGAQSDVARLEQELAQQQLEAVTLQLNTASSNASSPALSPKDEQNSRLAERQKYLALIDADYQLREAQIQLMRQTGQLEKWLLQAAKDKP